MKGTSMKHKKTIKNSEEEVHRWLRGADLGKLLPKLKFQRTSFPNLQPTNWDKLYNDFQKSKPISIRLPIRVLDQLKQVSLQKGLGYQALIRMWVTEKLQKNA